VRTKNKRGKVELALQQARYEVGRARRQYDAVDPDNRLVAAELEKRWNDRLAIVRNLETLRCCDDGIEIEFMDTLAPFDPTSVAIPNSTGSSDVAKASVGGRGLMLIAAYSEHVAYRHDGFYNRVTLKVNSEQPNLRT
jgi:hypothetical protein